MIVLVTGGASSGKSAFAERVACALPAPHVYLATMQGAGAEAAARIERHRALRAGKGFETVECPNMLESLAHSGSLPDQGTVLLEDLGNLAANEMFAEHSRTAGEVMAGIRIDATVERRDGTTAIVTVGVADLNIKAASADATAGTPSNMVMVKGGDFYCKSKMVGGVQHYVKQVISHDPEIGWGADWTGDYVLGSDGQFVEVE